MKRTISIIIVVIVYVSAIAQIQHGFVKTITRPNRPGVGIDSVLIKVKNFTKIRSHSRGKFSLELPGYKEGQGYELENVFKPGYELKNSGDLKKYGYSATVPLVIDMYSVKDKTAEQREIYNKIYTEVSGNFEKKYEKLLDELDNAQSDKAIIKKELADLQQRFDDTKCLIEKIASRYASIDYDKISTFEKELQQCIETGNIFGAICLINDEGGINAIVEEARQSQQEAALAKDIIEVSNWKVERAINSLYAMYIDALSNFDYLSAAAYMKQIADLDTCNFDNQISAADYMLIRGEYKNSWDYNSRALSIANKSGIREQNVIVRSQFGDICLYNNNFDKADAYYREAIDRYGKYDANTETFYFGGVDDEHILAFSDSLLISSLFMKLSIVESIRGHLDVANGHMVMFMEYKPSKTDDESYWTNCLIWTIGIGRVMVQIGQWQKAFDILSPIVLMIDELHSDNPSIKIISMVSNALLAQAEAHIIKEKSNSKKHVDRALDDLSEVPFVNNEIRTSIFVAASNVYQANHYYLKAFEFIDSAKVSYQNSFIQDTITMCMLLNNAGQLYWRERNWDKAIELFQEALATGYDSDNEKSPIVSMLLYNIGQNLREKNLLDSALIYHYKALEIRERMAEGSDIGIYTLAESYSAIANIYYMKQEYIKASDYYNKAYKVNCDIYNAYDKELLGAKRNEYLVLYYGKKNKMDNKELIERYNTFLQNHAFALICTKDSIGTDLYYVLTIDDWIISSDKNAIDIYNKCKDKNKIVAIQNGKIVSGQDLQLDDYTIGIVPINRDDKIRLIKLYKKNKKIISKYTNADDRTI